MENCPVIVGMACRVPGASNTSKLWENIINKKDLRRQIPRDRFNVEAFYHPINTHKGTTNTKYGYFLDQPLGDFDAEFFGVSGKEAEAMDPQQRMLLEVTYEALEDAGIPIETIRGSRTSVYCGMYTTSNDYHNVLGKDLEYYPKYAITGTGSSILSNRISYFYDLHGPSMTIDTGCSSSLVAFHLAAQSLTNDDADISLVVGSALNFAPNTYQTMADMGFLSSDGRCRSFDANGSGYARGDGICAIVIKRYRDATLAGDSIKAVVRATHVNHDGKTDGITLPSSEAQEALIRATYAKAGLDPDETQYFEAHGTGTKAGDPLEARAIGAVFGTTTRVKPLYIGSVKSNIGHLEGAAGLAGIIKATLAIQNATIPPNLNFNTPNPDILFEEWKISVPTTAISWLTPSSGPRRASINSFGYGGANAHAIIEQYQPPYTNGVIVNGAAIADSRYDTGTNEKRPYLLPLTSHSKDAGTLVASDLLTYIGTKSNVTVEDLAYSLCYRRSMHQFRCFAIGNSKESAAAELLKAQSTSTWHSKKNSDAVRIGFVFTGQGAQSFDMGRQLVQQSFLFREALERCDRVLQCLPDKPDWTIINELLRPETESRLSQSLYSQPICTAVQLAIVNLFREWEVKPQAVCGHSSGEIAAAYAAGILSLEAAIATAYYRGLHMNATLGQKSIPGSMMAVGLSNSETITELEKFEGRVVLAAINSPSNVTVSGDSDAIELLRQRLTSRNVFARLLKVEQAFHSHHMLPMAPGYAESLTNCEVFEVKSPVCRMFSSVTARAAESFPMDASYWADNMVQPVRFYDALVGTILDEDDSQLVEVLVEIGPHPALMAPSKEILKLLKIDVPYIGSLKRDSPAYDSLLECAGQLFTLGYPVDLKAVNQDQCLTEDGTKYVTHGKKLNDMPSYSWNHKNYWSLTRLIKEHLGRPFRHTLLGAPVPGSIHSMPRWRNYIRLHEIPWLRDHCVDGKVIFPAAGYCCMAIEATIRLRPDGNTIAAIRLKDVIIKAPLALHEDNDEGVETNVEIQPVTDSSRTLSDEWFEFTVLSYDETGHETEHSHGFISVEYGTPMGLKSLQKAPSADELVAKSNRYMSGAALYSRLDNINLHYGEYFALLKQDIACGPGYAVTSFEFDPSVFPPHELAEKTILHPTLLDSTFHVTFSAIETLLERQITDAFVSTYIAHLNISGLLVEQAGSAETRHYTVQTHCELSNQRTAVNHIFLHEKETGELIVEAQGNEVTALGTDSSRSSRRSLFFRQRWQPSFDHLEAGTCFLRLNDLGDLLRLYVNQHPTSRILHVTSDLQDTRMLAEALLSGTKRQLCEILHILTQLPLEDMAVQKLESDLDGLGRVCEPEGTYDLIIFDKNATLATGFDLSKVCNESSVIISNGFSPEDSGYSPKSFSPSQSWAVFRQTLLATACTDVTVVMPASPSAYTDDVLAMIEAIDPDRKVKITTLAGVVSEELRSKAVVVLASLDEGLSSPELWLGARTILTEENKTVVWVVQGATMEAFNPEHAQILGLLRTARNENKESRYISLDIDKDSRATLIAKRVTQALDPRNTEEDFADRQGCLYIPRIEEDLALNRKLPNGIRNGPQLERFGDYPILSLRVGQVGLLETLHFVEDEVKDLADDEVEIQVKASALNFHDVAVAMGIIQDYHLGNECAGVITRIGSKVNSDELRAGDRVVGWRPGQGSHTTLIHQPATLCLKIPDSMSFSVAASISIVLTTAYYSLYEIARLQPGETVLIHSAAGGVGQIAVQLAQRIGARVLATCSDSKRELLRNQFGLKDSEIFSSRDNSFVRGVLDATVGKGVDVALNSLAGKLLHTTWSCICPFGRFIEIGKRDIHQNSNLSMEPFRNNVSFASIDLILIYDLNPAYGKKLLSDSFKLLFSGEIVPPVGLHEFPYSQVDRAFRLMQLGKHTGKVVLIPGEDDMVLVKPRTYNYKQLFHPNKTYLLVGGLGGLGTATAEWMYGRGARSFAFMSRSGGDKPYARKTINWLRSKNAKVSIFRGDIGVLDDVKKVISDISSSLAGVFHIAVTLQDAMIRSLTFNQLETVLRTKVTGAWNLHEATLSLDLDFFVCWSSVSAICGNKGQAAYVAASAHMDALMRWRREKGLVGTAMNLGAVPTRGLVAENAEIRQSLERNKLDTLSEQELMFLVEEAVTLGRPMSNDLGLDWHQLIVGVNVKQPNIWWADRSVFKTLYANRDYGQFAAVGGARNNLAVLLASTTSVEAKTEVYLQAFIDKVATVLGTPIDSILPTNPLSFYGLDSIVAVEFRRWIKDTANVDLSLFDVLGAKSIHGLITKVVSLMPLAASTLIDKAEMRSGETSQEASHASSNSSQAISRIPKTRVTGPIPMSTFQARMYNLGSSSEEKWRLNLTSTFKIEGKPNARALSLALDELTQRQSVLSNAYLDDGGSGSGLVQRPLGSSSLCLVLRDLSETHSPMDQLRELINSSRRKILKIESGELASATLIKVSNKESYIILNAHHICFDRGSLAVFVEGWMNLYHATVSGQQPNTVPPPTTSYADFTLWHNAWLASKDMEPHRKWWKEALSNIPEASKLLPFAKQERPTILKPDRGLIAIQLDSKPFARLKRICSHLNATPFHFLLAAIRGFIFRYTLEDDVVLLMVDGNRPHIDVEEVVGCFVNLIPIRFHDNCSDIVFEELVLRASEITLDALSHCEISFDDIVDIVKHQRRPGYMPVSQIAVNYQMYSVPTKYHTPDFEMTTEELINITNPCELSFEMVEGSNSELQFLIEYSTELYSSKDMTHFSENFLAFLKSLIKDHRQPVTDVDM